MMNGTMRPLMAAIFSILSKIGPVFWKNVFTPKSILRSGDMGAQKGLWATCCPFIRAYRKNANGFLRAILLIFRVRQMTPIGVKKTVFDFLRVSNLVLWHFYMGSRLKYFLRRTKWCWANFHSSRETWVTYDQSKCIDTRSIFSQKSVPKKSWVEYGIIFPNQKKC